VALGVGRQLPPGLAGLCLWRAKREWSLLSVSLSLASLSLASLSPSPEPQRHKQVDRVAAPREARGSPGGNPGANRRFLLSTPIQIPPESGGICGRLTSDSPPGRPRRRGSRRKTEAGSYLRLIDFCIDVRLGVDRSAASPRLEAQDPQIFPKSPRVGSYPQALQAAKQWLRLRVDVRLGVDNPFSRPALRHGSLNSLFQVALYLPS